MNDRLSQASFGSAAAVPGATRSQGRVPAPRLRRPRRRFSQRLRRGLVGAAFLAVTALIAVVILLFHLPRPATLVFLGADYATNLAVPDNALGWNGLNELARLGVNDEPGGWLASWRARHMTRPWDSPARLTSRDGWKDLGWDRLGASPTVVIYIDMHGAADERGPYLLADDPNLDQHIDGKESRIYLEELLDFLKNDRHVRNRHKLLILDVTKVEGHEPLALHNDFVRQLEQLDKKIADVRHLAVICASKANQRSWASEDLRMPVLAHAIQEGLLGSEADRNGNQQITGLELYDYAADKVRAWARDNRGAEQELLLLPAGDGRDRAERMNLALVGAQTRPPEPPDPPSRLWLTERWEEHDKLLASNPRPYVYAPHLWQEYQETLLRCESLARAGYGDQRREVASLLNQLGTLKDHIGRASRSELNRSLRNSLALRVALEPPATKAAASFGGVWNDYAAAGKDAGQRARAAEKLRDQDAVSRLAFYDWLFSKVADKTEPGDLAGSLTTAADLCREVEPSGKDRPAEVLFLIMLATHLPDDVRKSKPELVQKALRVRRLAEEAALGIDRAAGAAAAPAGLSERSMKPFRDRIEAADDQRRLAEDHLFVGGTGHLAASQELFDKAEKSYKQAAEDFAVLRVALGVSARAHADLPCYSRWLARSHVDTLKDSFEEAVSLWDQVHKLDDALEGRQFAAAKQQAADIDTRLDRLRDRYRTECADLGTPAVKQQADTWRRLDDVLAVPMIEAGQRQHLLSTAGDISALLNRKAGRSGESTATAEKPGELPWRHARLALHAIGQRRFDDNLNPDDVPYGGANVARPGLHKWDENLLPVSRRVSQVFRESAQDVRAHAQAADAPEAKADAALGELRQAEAPCRLAPGGLLGKDAPNPVEVRRRWETHDLLRWLARRTILDRWWSEKEEGTPYFVSAGGDYLGDAGQFIKDGDNAFARDRRKDRELHDLLDARNWPRCRFDRVGEGADDGVAIHIAGIPGLKLPFQLPADLLPLPKDYAPKDLPLGVVAVTRAAETAGGAWEGLDLATAQAAVPVPLPLDNPHKMKLLLRDKYQPKDPVLRKATLTGLFRGRKFGRPIDVYIHPTADTIIPQLPVPDTAGISVTQAEDLQDWVKARQNILVIVLDLTGSMVQRKVSDGSTRKAAAIKALDAVLADVEDETVVSVMTFGQRDERGKEYPTPEDSIKTQFGPSRWRGEDRKGLIKKLDDLVAHDETPLARAVWESKANFRAAEKLIGGGRRDVRKTLLVLTDGKDNRFDKDGDLQRKTGQTSISGLLTQEFAEARVSVNMVVLSDDEEEKTEARNQFKRVVTQTLQPKGTYYDAKIIDAAALTRALRAAMRLQPNYQLLRGNTLVLPLGEPDDAAHRNLATVPPPNWTYHYARGGRYELTTWVDPDILQPAYLAPGELLRLKLSRDGFRRALVSDEAAFRSCYRARDGGWRLTALQSTVEIDSSHTLLLALESERDLDKVPNLARQERPRSAWFELSWADGASPNGVLWGEKRGAAAPIWEVRVPAADTESSRQVDWNKLKEVTAWVSDQSPIQFAVPVFAGGNAPEGVDKGVSRDVPIGVGKSAHVEVGVEEFDVEDGLGRKRQGFRCLVVRANYNADAQLRAVLPEGISPTKFGAEHHYYSYGKTGTYTGVFWFLDGMRPEDHAGDLLLMSVTKSWKDGATKLSIPREALKRVTDTSGLAGLSQSEELRKRAEELPQDEPKPGGKGDGR